MSKKGILLTFATACISGFAIFFNQFGVKQLDSDIFTFSKNVLVVVFLLSIILMLRKWREIKNLSLKNWGRLALIGFIGGSIPFILFFKGLQLSSGVNGAFIHKTLFIFVIILAVLFLREKFSLKMAFAGLSLMLGIGLLVKIPEKFIAADLLILIATIFWAVENVISKWVLKDLSGFIVAFGRMFFGSFFILIYLIAVNKTGLILTSNSSQIGWILLSSVILFGYVSTWYNGIKKIPISLASMILILGLPITVLLNALYNFTLPPLPKIEGSLLIIFGILLSLFAQKKFKVKNRCCKV